jgi:hypothetical protein
MAKGKHVDQIYTPVDASPVKSFFVTMLTRDIKLEEAILDLLDNCVDGVLRAKNVRANDKKPYSGFWADIDFSSSAFSISDNCGGIPWDLHKYAFRMGRSNDRPHDTPGTVGVYGIGMKRAIFKMGESCQIQTQNKDNSYEVDISVAWVRDQTVWNIPVKKVSRKLAYDGTKVVVGNLLPGIATRFGDESQAFTTELERMISSHYAFIIDKGFTVKINGKIVLPKPTKLIFAKDTGPTSIRPFIFKTKIGGVSVFMAIGFTRGMPSQNEIKEEQEQTRYSSQEAGWTVLCNDRAVLYCDRTELTGWGEAGVPRYHTQFIAISGIVEFRAEDASELPTTTTKRGIDASSILYLQIKNKMREGLSLFTNYTNKWKGFEDEAKKHIESGTPLSFEEIKIEASKMNLRSITRSSMKGEQYRPDLPMPKKLEAKRKRISFVRDTSEVKLVSDYLFDDSDCEPDTVGEQCFELFLKEAKK